MIRIKSLFGWLVCLFAALLMMAPSSPAAQAPGMTVGRIFHIAGDLLRYVPETKDWVAAVPDAPFGAGDTLFSGSNSMAELIVPNGAWIRTGNNTQIQFITLDADLAQMDVASGMARFYSKGKAALKVTSSFGYVLADPGTIFDLYVGDNSLEVVAIKGKASFVHAATTNRYDVMAGAASVLADPQQVSMGDGTVDPDWNRWNMDRENFWLAKDQVKGPSAEYLPPDLRSESYALDGNGSWERVPYEGEDRWFWRPTVVAADWSPFTVGRWTDWYGDETWIPAEPFGYITHHYGNWIYARNRWYWAPPVAVVRIGLPLLNIGFFWCPGRVAWIHSGVHVGWVPLAPRETYYSRHPWGGPHAVVVNKININQISIKMRDHAYIDHAIIVKQNDFHGRNDYRNARVPNVNHTIIINQYRAAPVVNNQVIKNYSQTKQRFNFTNAPVPAKPHNAVLNRIRDNEKIIRKGEKVNASVLQERIKGVPEGRINRDARVEQPRGVNHIVPVKEVNRPKAELKLPEREIKGGGRGVPPAQSGQTAQPAGHVPLSGPDQTAQPAGRMIPTRPGQPEQPTPRTERKTPARPPQAAQPAQPGQPTQPAKPTERVSPATSPQPGQPKPTERMIPVRPAQSASPAKPAERVAPVKPTQPEPPDGRVAPVRPATQAEQATPARPAQPSRPAKRGIPATSAPPTQAMPKTERVVPPRSPQAAQPTQPDQPVQPARPPVRMAPAASAPPAQTVPKTERAAPVSTPQVTQPAQPRPVEHVIPARPAQTSQPAAPSKPTERVIPAAPAPPAPPAHKTERAAPARPAQPEPVKTESKPSHPEPKEKRTDQRQQPGR